MFFKDKVAFYIIVIVVGTVLLELAVFILAVSFIFGFIEVTELVRSTELFFFNNTFETLEAPLRYLKYSIGLKNVYLYGG